MKKRVFCILLAVVLSFGLLALVANADDEKREIQLIFDLDGGFVKEGYTLPTSYIFVRISLSRRLPTFISRDTVSRVGRMCRQVRAFRLTKQNGLQ